MSFRKGSYERYKLNEQEKEAMKIKENSGGGDFKLLPAGTHAAVCTMIVGIGPQVVEFQDHVKESEKVKLRFEVPAERIAWVTKEGVAGEGPMVIWATYTCSLHEKSKLRKHLQAWRGRDFTEAELAGFELNNVLGKPCLLSVVHRTAPNGKTYANIDSISGLMKGMAAPLAEGELISFDFDDHSPAELAALPDWLQQVIAGGKALRAEQEARALPFIAPEAEEDAPPWAGEEEIPF